MQRQSPANSLFGLQHNLAVAAMMGVLTSYSPAFAQSDVFSSITELDLPVGPGAQEPSLFAMDDGRILMSWTEPAEVGFAVKTVIGDQAGWAEPQTVVVSNTLFVNWADFPSIAAFADGTLAVNWLMENGPSTYNYDMNIALSPDNGRSWGDVIVPHRDSSQRQHGFATLLPVQDRLMAIWLDGRAFDIDATGEEENAFTNAMQLRVTTIGVDGSLADDILLDARTCTCCQTSAAVTGDGTVLVAYRDRTAEEVRDISLVRLVDGVWSEPASVHADGWEIDGCPVNGPAIDAAGGLAVVAWFSAADDIPIVNVAFSDDSGASFGAALQIDQGEAAGRVDVLQLGDGSALVSWIEWTDAGEALFVCRARPESGCGETQLITLNDAAGLINFPSMVLGDDGVYIAWTQPLDAGSPDPEMDVTVRMVFAEF